MGAISDFSIEKSCKDPLGGEPPPLTDSGAQPPALLKRPGYGGPCCPGPEAGLSGHPPARPRIGLAPGSVGEYADRVFRF